MNTATRHSLSLVLLASAIGCQGGKLDVGSANVSSDAAPGPGQPGAAATSLPEGAIAQLDEEINAIAVDGTRVYLAGYGHVYEVPKAGGAIVSLFHDEPGLATSKSSVAVDDTYVYFPTIAYQLQRVSRIRNCGLKCGATAQTLADRLGFPDKIAVDETHVYISVHDSSLAGSAPGSAIVRVAKGAGAGAVELVAGAQPAVTAMTLHGGNVYFASGSESPEGSLRRVPKAGGAVEVLATAVDTQVPSREGRFSLPSSIASLHVFGDKLAFSLSGRLAFVPLAGGPVDTTPLMIADLLVDGSSLVVVSVDPSASAASLQRVGPLGTAEATLARWVYVATESGIESVSPAVAMTTDGERAFWVDADYRFRNTTGTRSTVRSAPLR
jgi:hypothetical protein